MDFQVPQSQRRTVKALLSLTPDTLNKVASALRAVQPSMSLKDCAEVVAQRASISEQDAARILVMLAGLFGLRDREASSRDEVASRVLAAIEADAELTSSEAARRQLRQFLDEALMLEDSVGITSKAWSVTREYERTYCSSRTLTDLRPVFKTESQEPAAFIVMHNLRIAFHEGDEMREFYVALRTKDLEDLKTVLDRATTKGRQLHRVAERLDAPIVEVD